MAGMNPSLPQTAAGRIPGTSVRVPRVLMSWEDWLTFSAVVIAFLSVAFSLEQANWVDNMPRLVPTALAGLIVGLVAARIRVNAFLIQPFVLAIGALVVVAAAQNFADGASWTDRVSDFWVRMREWFAIVRNGDISSDNLPFVTLVHSLTFVAAYFAAWSIFRWHNPWLSLVPGGFVLLSNISFLDGKPSTAFVIFLFAAMLIVSRAHIQKNQARWNREGVEYPEYISLNALNLTFWLALALIIGAWQIPLGTQASAAEGVISIATKPFSPLTDDFTRLFHSVDSRKGAKLHNFGDTLPIQGEVELGSKILLEVSATEPGFIRGASYDEYTGAGWKATGREVTRVEGGTATDESSAYQSRVASILRVTVIDKENTIFTLGTPLGTNQTATFAAPEGQLSDIEHVRSTRGLDDGDGYNAIGSVSRATADQLREAGTDYPNWVLERYLQTPDDLPVRVNNLTLSLVRETPRNPYDQAVAIEDYLRELPYSLDVPTAPPGRDTVDYLLFDLKTGYFDYQATAMAVMLRTLGIPSRIAVGYALDADSAEETKYTVRKSDAYSWVEVFFPGYGWVPFNPTSDRPAGGASSLGETPFQPGGDTSGLGPDEIPVDELDFGPVVDQGALDALDEETINTSGPPWILIWSMSAILTVLVAVTIAGRITWNWGLAGLEGRSRAWARVQRLSRWAGLDGASSETPREWSRRVGTAVERPSDANVLASGYQESRYGRADARQVTDAEVDQSYRSLRGVLLKRILRWKRKAPK
ncbi:MAG: transglutaminase domain-containing protein [Tepidiformaceae bacterium]